MPFIDRTRERRVSRRPIAIGFAGAMAVLLLTLTWKGSSAPNIERRGDGDRARHRVREAASPARQLPHAQGRWAGAATSARTSTPRSRTTPWSLDRVTNGKAPMPAFKGKLTEAQIKCIATVVADADHRRRRLADARKRSPARTSPRATRATRPPARVRRYPARVRFFLGITGASGAPYAARVLAGLPRPGAEVGVCASRVGRRGHRVRGLPRSLARSRRGGAPPGGRARRRAHDAVRRARLVLALRLGLGEGATAT